MRVTFIFLLILSALHAEARTGILNLKDRYWDCRNQMACNMGLIKAIRDENIDKVVSLIDLGANINKFYNEDERAHFLPLTEAVKVNNEEIKNILLESGAEITKTLINFAMKDDSTSVMELLTNYNYQATYPTNRVVIHTGEYHIDEFCSSNSIFSTAVETGNTEVLNYILAEGANPNSLCEGRALAKMMPLHFAIINNQPAVVRLLLEKGANINATIILDRKYTRKYEYSYTNTTLGETPLKLAVLDNNFELVKVLVESGAAVRESLIELDKQHKERTEITDFLLEYIQ